MAKKKAVKRKAVKRKTAVKKTAGKHTDTKSHNVNIRIISGIENIKAERKILENELSDNLKHLLPVGAQLKIKGNKERAHFLYWKQRYTQRNAYIKKELKKINKLIEKSFK